MREQMVNLTKKLRIIPLLLTLALATSMTGAALAAPPFQEGGDQTGGVEQDADQNDNEDQPEDAQDATQPQSQFQQGDQQQQNQQEQFQQGQQEQFQQPTAACEQQYTVQAGDSLSLIAQRFYNDLQAYNVIFEATNTAANTGDTFTAINDPNVIEVGQTLCIPAQAGQQQAAMQQPGQQQDQAQQTGQQAGMQQDELSVPQGMSKVIFENLSSRDLIVDISEGPTPQSVWVEPGTRQEFVVEPGEYVIMGHEPGGEFGVPSNRIELMSGELVGYVCDDAADCWMQQGVQEILALRGQGQGMMQQQNQQDTMQQQNQQNTQQQNQPGTMQPGQQDESDTMEQDQPGTTQPGQQNDDQGQSGQQSSG